MRLLKQTMAVLGTVSTIAVLLAFIAPKTSHALVAALVQIVPGTATHVGQNESQLVRLTCYNVCSYSGNLPSYTVPAGYTLIVTDFTWELIDNPPGLTCDQIFSFDPPTEVVQTCAAAVGGTAYSSEHFTTGFDVPSGAFITENQCVGGLGNCNAGSIFIMGYLVPNP